jgi:hypothetical protein
MSPQEFRIFPKYSPIMFCVLACSLLLRKNISVLIRKVVSNKLALILECQVKCVEILPDSIEVVFQLTAFKRRNIDIELEALEMSKCVSGSHPDFGLSKHTKKVEISGKTASF